jgi:Flp pilus assembly pilin Flp
VSANHSVALLSDERGVATVEYVLVLSLVSVALVAPLVGLGVALLHLFNYQQAILLFPAP